MAPSPTVILIRPTPISSQDMEPAIFIATANMSNDVAKLLSVLPMSIILTIFLSSTVFENSDIDPSNSPNNAVTASNEAVNFSESINEITSNEPANIAIAVAISFNVLAFNCCVNAPNASPTPPIISLIFSRIPPALSRISPPDFMNLAINTPIDANIPPFSMSNKAL